MSGEEETRPRKITEEVVRLSQSEKVRNYLIGIGALTGLILGLLAQFKGEPEAEEAQAKADKTWETLRVQLNKQAEVVNRLYLRVIHLQGHQEGFNSGALQSKLDDLQARYDKLLSSKAPTPQPTATAAGPPPKECKEGYLLDARNQCRKVPKSVAKAARATAEKAKAIQEALIRERKARKKAEKQAARVVRAREDDPLSKLPKNLKDAQQQQKKPAAMPTF